MLVMALGITYMGAALCYAASSSAPPGAAAPLEEALPKAGLRVGGGLLLAAGLAGAVLTRPATDGLLVWLSMTIGACSLLAVAAPLIDRFVPVSAAVALGTILLSVWA
jgi:hypothetical protein